MACSSEGETLSPARNARTPKRSSTVAIMPKVQRHAISITATAGACFTASNPARIGEEFAMENRRLLHHDVDQLAGHDDHFHDLLAIDEHLYLLVGEGELAHFI